MFTESVSDNNINYNNDINNYRLYTNLIERIKIYNNEYFKMMIFNTITLTICTFFFTYETCLSYVRGDISEKCIKPFNDTDLPIADKLICANPFGCLQRVREIDTGLKHQSPESIAAKFAIHTRNKNTTGIEFLWNGANNVTSCNETGFQYDIDILKSTDFNINRRTIIMIPGYLTGDVVDWITELEKKWLELGDFNVISVSWSSGNRYFYSRAAANLPFVARQISILLHYLAQIGDTNLNDENFLSKIHMIGHSLGAHMAGFVGYELGGRVGRISGLDPAGPIFDTMKNESRLDETDARLVDIYHTNGGKMSYINMVLSSPAGVLYQFLKYLPGLRRTTEWFSSKYSNEGDTAWFGYDDPLGHLDYYANNGRTQPGCDSLMHTCDHIRATQLLRDILDYEIGMKRSGLDLKRAKNRLVAFKANDYGQFMAGSNLKDSCSSLIATSSLGESKILNKCSVPIDFLSDPTELRKEFEHDYNIQFKPVDLSNGPKFYMKTLSDTPLVGDHFLLKLELARNFTWNETCSLHADIYMEGKPMSTVKLNKAFDAVDMGPNGFFGLAIPFVQPIELESRHRFNQLITISPERLPSELRDYLARILSKNVLPNTIELSIMIADSTGLIEAVTGYKSSDNNQTIDLPCELMIESVSVTPIWRYDSMIAGEYDQEIDNATINEKVAFVTSFSEQGRVKSDPIELTFNQKQPVKKKWKLTRLLDL